MCHNLIHKEITNVAASSVQYTHPLDFIRHFFFGNVANLIKHPHLICMDSCLNDQCIK